MKQVKPIIHFNFVYSFSFTGRKKLKNEIDFLFRNEKIPLTSLDYIFCSDEYLLKINKDYLDHDTLTDIITFDLSEDVKPIIGEIYISVDRVKENAQDFSVPFQTEIRRVIFHGALHLCGYRDKRPAEKREMRAKEDYYLNLK